MGTNLLTDADIETIKGEITLIDPNTFEPFDDVLALVRRLAAAPREQLTAEALRAANRAKALFDERNSTTDPARHAEVVVELAQAERELSVYHAALVENLPYSYGISINDLLR